MKQTCVAFECSFSIRVSKFKSDIENLLAKKFGRYICLIDKHYFFINNNNIPIIGCAIDGWVSALCAALFTTTFCYRGLTLPTGRNEQHHTHGVRHRNRLLRD